MSDSISSLPLGRLEPVDVRNYWKHEAIHFTPWLAQADNLALLGDTIGIELELEAVEKSVGPFSADILCKETATNDWVLIENQLEKTDHSHLGQILTYTAGLQAKTVLWIARDFTEEHRAALNWLNEHTREDIRFFGITVELWRIGNSPLAPRFNIVVRPNDWSKAVEANKELSDMELLKRRYWTAFAEMVKANPGPLRPPGIGRGNWVNIAIGRSNVTLAAVIKSDKSLDSYGTLPFE